MASPKRKSLAQVTGFDTSRKAVPTLQVRKRIKPPQDKRLVKLVQARQGVVLVFVVEQYNELQDAWANAIWQELVPDRFLEFGPAKGIARIWRRDPYLMNKAAENAESGYLRRAMLTIQDEAWTAENKLLLAESVRDVSATKHFPWPHSCRFTPHLYLVKFLNHADTADPMSQGVRRYVVPDNFDETPEELQPLDEYMLFNAIYSYIRNAFEDEEEGGWHNWYLKNTAIADDFYRRPYPYVARSELGYPIANLEGQNNE